MSAVGKIEGIAAFWKNKTTIEMPLSAFASFARECCSRSEAPNAGRKTDGGSGHQSGESDGLPERLPEGL
jgi:hypothetical protein